MFKSLPGDQGRKNIPGNGNIDKGKEPSTAFSVTWGDVLRQGRRGERGQIVAIFVFGPQELFFFL